MPNPILTDAVLCKLAENKELRGINPRVAPSGQTVWRARLFAFAAVVPVGTYSTPLDAINAVRHKANTEWSLKFSDEQLFWREGRMTLQGISNSECPALPWRVSVSRDWERFPIGCFPDLLSALEARDNAKKDLVSEQSRRKLRESIAERIQAPGYVPPNVTKQGRFMYEILTDAAEKGFVRGVRFDKKTELWRARLIANGTRIHLGCKFPCARSAIDAVRRAAQNYRLGLTDEDLFVLRKTNGDPKPAPLGFRGITWHKGSGRWCVRRSEQGTQKYIGLFDTLPEAVAALHES